MLSKQQNDFICKVGRGTPMGELMRQYWIPALLSSELPEPDGRPVRLRLLGEDLVAFRDTTGRVGIMAHNCPHRGASLFFGRNEEEGLRCVYHGWKFDVSGRCVDMPNEPPEIEFQGQGSSPRVSRPGARRRRLGLHGHRAETPPPLPALEPNMVPEDSVTRRSCATAIGCRALEGDIDTSHLGFLHLGAMKPEQMKPGTFDYYTVNDRAPRYEVVDTDFGTMYGAYRPAEEDTNYWRMAALPVPLLHDDSDWRSRAESRLSAPGCRSTTTTRCSGTCTRRRNDTGWRTAAKWQGAGGTRVATCPPTSTCRTQATSLAAGN